ncbi:MAG: pilus assembly protein, partial [Gammaproteobacteria bacterium]
MTSQRVLRRKSRAAIQGLIALCLTVMAGVPASYSAPPSSSPPSPIPLSDTPLILVTPAHPQVLMLLGNSQSMDGNLSGAIMTGAPGTYPVFTGFTPPVQGPNSAGDAPYTVTNNGVQYDNSDSRLNVAKQAIQQTLTNYQAVTDFGLMDLGTSGSPVLYTTWVYFMSQPGGFTFTSTAGNNTYANPCYNVGSNPYRISSGDCNPLAVQYRSAATSDPYFVAAQTSDAPSVNDVLYAPSSYPTVFVSYDGPYKGTNWSAGKVTSPYPPTFSLTDYNNGSVLMGYHHVYGYGWPFATGPTNAGYVPYSDEVMYAERGFGYYNNVTNSGKLLMPVAVDSTSRRSSFAALLAPETNQPDSGEIKSNAVNAALAGMLQSAYGYYTGSSAPPSSNGCTPQRYVVLITDGLPTVDLAGNAWPPLGSDAANGYGVSATFDSTTGALSSTNDQALTDTIAQIAALKQAGIDTYVVGMGAGVDPTKNPQAAASLKAMAYAGGTTDYFAATTPSQVAADLRVILTQIQSNNLATSSAAVDSTSLSSTSTVYQGRFNPDDTPYNDWTGDLLAFPLGTGSSVNTTSASAIWSAQQRLDAKVAGTGWDSGRVIVTYDPVSSSGVPFRWADISSSGTNNQQSLLMTSTTDTLGPARLNYLRGDTSNEVRNGGTFRN